MLAETLRLTRLALADFCGINRFRHTKDPAAKKRYIVLAAAWILVAAMMLFYVGGLSVGLITLGLGEILPAYLAFIASAVVLMFGIFKAGFVLFSTKNYDLLAAFPLRKSAIVLSRFLYLYVYDLIFSAGVLLPGMAVYGYLCRPAFGFYLAMTVGALLLPLLPLALSALLGTLVAAVAARMRRQSILKAVLTVALVLAVLFLSFRSGDLAALSPEALTSMADAVGQLLGDLYPPALWLSQGAVAGNVGLMLLLAGVSVAAAVLAILLAVVGFDAICRRLSITAAKQDYRMESLQSKGLGAALYRREWKRYLSSAGYVMNTAIGPLLALVLAGSAFFWDAAPVEAAMPFAVSEAAPFLFALVLTMMTTTCVSLSLEGNTLWLMQTLPVTAKALFDAKIRMNLTMYGVVYAIGEVLLCIALRPTLGEVLWLLLIPAVIALFVPVFGITVNLKWHRFDWENEVVVVKQSLPAAVGGFAGPICALAGMATLLIPDPWRHLAKAVYCALILGLTALCYLKNNQAKLQKL